MARQKFVRGDVVRVVRRFPKYMSHFSDSAGKTAIVEGSYADLYGGRYEDGGSNAREYSLYFPTLQMGASWYPEELLTSVRKRTRKSIADLEKFLDIATRDENED